MAQWIEDPQSRPEVEKVTKELKLPIWKANHKGKFRDFWNELWDKIEDYCIKLKEGSKKTDDRLNSALGRNDGDFPIANAVVGNVYYSELTKKYYKCKVGGPAPMPNGNFIDLSILENLNRLENLIKIKKYSATTQDYISINAGTLIISESRIDNLKNKIGIPLNSTIVSVSTGQSAGYCEYCTYNYESDTAIVGHIVPSGNSRTVVINVAYI